MCSVERFLETLKGSDFLYKINCSNTTIVASNKKVISLCKHARFFQMDYIYNVLSQDLPVLAFGVSDRCRSFLPMAIEVTKNESLKLFLCSTIYFFFCKENNCNITIETLVTDLAP